MDIYSRDSSGSRSSTPEVRLILVGNMGCGKTLTADTLLNDSSNINALMPSRLSEVRSGVSEGRRLKVVETPRWYWKGEHIEGSVQRETEKALSLVAPGPHAFLILVPVGQFTEMEARIPVELERVFGRGALQHTLVLLTCGDYLAGRDHKRYISTGESGFRAVVNECGGRWHVINNRRPEDRKQVVSLLEKVEQLTKMSGGCYLPSPMQRHTEGGMHENYSALTRSYSLSQEALVHQNHSTPSQTAWSKEETFDESGRRKIRVRSMGPATGRLMSQQLANGLYSQTWYDDTATELRQKRTNYKLSKEGAILSQMSETDQLDNNQSNQNFINTIHYHISTVGDTRSAPSDSTASLSPSFRTFSSSSCSSAAFAPSSSTYLSPYSSSTLSSSTTKDLSSSSTYHSSFSSSSLPSSPTKALSSVSSTGISSFPTDGTYSSSTYQSSYSSSNFPFPPTEALSSSYPTSVSSYPSKGTSPSSSTYQSSYSSSTYSSTPTKASFSAGISSFPLSNATSSFSSASFSPSYNGFSASSSTPTSSAFSPNSQSSVFFPTTEISSSFPNTNASFPNKISSSSYSSSYASSLSPSATLSTTASSFFSNDSSEELRIVLLGRTGSGKSAAGNAILGRDEFKIRKDDATGATTHSCVKGTTVIRKKQVTVVDTPDWFWPPENMATHLSSCMDLCAPGPHVFLLCVPVTLPGRSNLHDLSSLKNSFGPDNIQHRTLVLFTHSDKLKDRNVEEYIAAKRPELLELVEKCEDRFHVLKQGGNEGNIGELLEKVEQVVKESGGSHYSCQAHEEVGSERITQLRRGSGKEDNIDRANSSTLHSLREEEEVEQEEKNASTLKSTAYSVASVLGTVLRFVGQKLGQGAQQVPKPLAGGAVLGGVLGLYFGGPIGGAVGATAGSAAAEYGRRKYNKPKTD